MDEQKQYEAQCARIVTALEKLDSDANISFDADAAPHEIRFSVKKGSLVLIPSSGHINVAELAAKGGEELEEVLHSLSDRKI